MQQQRRRFTRMDQLEDRLAAEARRLREEAKLLPPGIAREQALRKARQAETGSHISEWLRSPGLQPHELCAALSISSFSCRVRTI